MEQEHSREGLIKPRWYDGPLYGWFFDPLEREKEKIVSCFVEPEARVLDAPSGTGALSFALAKKAKEVVGVDASSRMLAFARKRKAVRAAGNVSFVEGDITALPKSLKGPFDFGVISLFLHEVDEPSRVAALTGVASLCKKVVICDYAAPQPFLPGLFNTAVEYVIGGPGNFPFYRDFLKRGGTCGLAERCGLVVLGKKTDRSGGREYCLLGHPAEN